MIVQRFLIMEGIMVEVPDRSERQGHNMNTELRTPRTGSAARAVAATLVSSNTANQLARTTEME